MILKSWIFCGLKFKEIFKLTTINLNHIHQMVWSEKRFLWPFYWNWQMCFLLILKDTTILNSYNLSHCYNCNTILDYFLKWLILRCFFKSMLLICCLSTIVFQFIQAYLFDKLIFRYICTQWCTLYILISTCTKQHIDRAN